MNRRLVRRAAACAAIAAGLVLMGADTADGPAGPPQVKHGRILVVPIEGEIDRVQGAFFHRVLAGANDNAADGLVLFYAHATLGGDRWRGSEHQGKEDARRKPREPKTFYR